MQFISTLPVGQSTSFPTSTAPCADPVPPVGKTPAQPNGQVILVVDDDVALRSTAAMMLEIQGFKTLTARNGLEALQQLERHPEVGAVLLDVYMPVMDGEETFRALRSSWASLPVILLSGFDLGDVATRFGHPLPDGFIQKPFTIARLTSAITGVLN